MRDEIGAHSREDPERGTDAGASTRGEGRPDREWIAVLAHELRTPVGAILGYAELLADGAFGTLQKPAADAVRRLRAASDQLLLLLEALDEGQAPPLSPGASVRGGALIDDALAAVASEAEARGITFDVADGDTIFFTDPVRAGLAFRLALGAVLKTSPGAELRISTAADPVPHVLVEGTGLDPRRDDPATRDGLTGAGLRMALARRAARAVRGSVSVEPAGEKSRLRLTLPFLSIDDSEETP